jgi:hypothetical protein
MKPVEMECGKRTGAGQFSRRVADRGDDELEGFMTAHFDDARVTRAIEATGRKKLIFAGISIEVCAAFPAITAIGKGIRRVCGGGRLGNIQRDQAASWTSAYATGWRRRLGLHDLDGGNSQG